MPQASLDPELHLRQGATTAEGEATLLERAQAANEADHALTWLQAISKYRKAVFWACVFSFTLTMQASDATQASSCNLVTEKLVGFGLAD